MAVGEFVMTHTNGVYNMDIKYLNLKKITESYREEILEAVTEVVDSGWFLQGEANRRFESHYADYCGMSYCVGCANGLDALTITLRSLIESGEMEKGDEVIVPANTYIATILAITENHLKAVLVEPRKATFQIDDRKIEAAITERTRAIMLVNLYGKNAFTPKVGKICLEHKLRLIVDNAQGHGLSLNYPDKLFPLPVVCHSFYPGKNLGALGDGGAITTNDKSLACIFRTLANYGSSRKYHFDYCGRNSRLDELQAAILDVKLHHVNNENSYRHAIALRYIREIANPALTLPSETYWLNNVFHIFPILTKNRDSLQQYLTQKGIQTMIHYPIPPHLQKCYAFSPLIVKPTKGLPVTEQIHNQELSIPCNSSMTYDEVSYIISVLNEWESL